MTSAISDTTTTVSHVTAHLSGRPVLCGIDLSIVPGVTALVGRNGAGKTSLIRVLTGVVEPTEGEILRGGQSIWKSAATMRDHRRSLGWLPQEPGYPPRMSVRDFVGYAAWLKEVPRSRRQSEVDQALDLADLRDREVVMLGRLSGGQRRRAALAASIVGTPALVLLDEPTHGLDPMQRSRFLSHVTTLSQTASVVLATHLLEDVALAADRWFALAKGIVVARGTVDRRSTETIGQTTEDIRAALAADVSDE